MFKNYIKTAYRNIFRRKGYSFINITGLAIGLAVCVLIMLWAQDELDFDRSHKNAENAHLLVYTEQLSTGRQVLPAQMSPLAPLLKENIPEILNYTRYVRYKYPLASEDKSFTELVCFADPAYFEIFTFPLVEGDSKSVLSDPHAVVISQKIARKFFGDESALGRVLTLDNNIELTVSGVMKDIPANSSVNFEVVMPLTIRNEQGNNIENWAGADYFTYLLLDEKTDIAAVNGKIQDFCCGLYKQMRGGECNFEMDLQSLAGLHLYGLSGQGGTIQYVYIMIAVALIILIIACMNFINITTARSAGRAKEIGLRKVAGAHRSNLIAQLLGEAVLLALISFMLAMVIVELILPVFNDISQKSLSIGFSNWKVLLGFVGLVIVTGVFSGGYTAFYISGFQPVKVLKGFLKGGRGGMRFRRMLVVAQFTLSVAFIICTLVLFRQVTYIHSKDLGFDKENVIFFSPTGGAAEHYDTFKKELLQNPGIKSVTSSAQNLVHINSTIGNNWNWEGRDPTRKLEIHFDWVSFDYARTFGMEMVEGRFYSREIPTDTLEGIVVNESLMRLAGIKDPVGKKFSYWGRDCRIIGVVKDFHLEPLYETLKPMLLIYSSNRNNIYVRLAPGDAAATLGYIEEIYKKFEPEAIFTWSFMNDAYNRIYRTEQRLLTVFKYAAGLTIFVSCLGLFGLVAYMAEQRTREIGIRKVLGSSVTGIVRLLTKEFILLVIIANLIAWAPAYLLINRLLENYAYRIEIGLTSFLLSGLLILTVAILTVGYQAVRAALTNPVKALRHE